MSSVRHRLTIQLAKSNSPLDEGKEADALGYASGESESESEQLCASELVWCVPGAESCLDNLARLAAGALGLGTSFACDCAWDLALVFGLGLNLGAGLGDVHSELDVCSEVELSARNMP